MTCKMQKQTVGRFLNIWSDSYLKKRNPNNANPTPELLSTVKLLILTDVPCRLHANYVGIMFLTVNSKALTVNIWVHSYLMVTGTYC